jgi:hypothetical protein
MSKYNIKMTMVTPTNMPNDRFVEFDLYKFVMADNLRKMLYKIVNFEKDFTRVKHLNIEIKE